ncbi:hypothetical protein [Brachybacterium kimchii]|uniref:Uncharacterized protein n=1 Tax=Brachybacterium kimchii TaxID=2942909 RepID=A0ABY4N7J6_9MICO|nr:hypothetical protein [Brachybacterium kimchii]UQN30528.1 hypothetical protein M4486_04245 [Brachybacterium kimchii]
MASLIESVRKLHGPTLVTHENGYDVDVICAECTRLRLEALNLATADGDDWKFSEESARITYPCPTRVVAGTSESEGKVEASQMRLEHLVVQRDELEERMERLDAVISLIRRDLGEDEEKPSSPEPPAEDAGDADEQPAPDDPGDEADFDF